MQQSGLRKVMTFVFAFRLSLYSTYIRWLKSHQLIYLEKNRNLVVTVVKIKQVSDQDIFDSLSWGFNLITTKSLFKVEPLTPISTLALIEIHGMV